MWVCDMYNEWGNEVFKPKLVHLFAWVVPALSPKNALIFFCKQNGFAKQAHGPKKKLPKSKVLIIEETCKIFGFCNSSQFDIIAEIEDGEGLLFPKSLSLMCNLTFNPHIYFILHGNTFYERHHMF